MEKVFCIGMYKTGTTSVGKALEVLGLRTFHGTNPILDVGNDKFDWRPDEFAKYRDKFRNLTSLYDAFEDYPFMWIYREMHEDFPDARFILTERDSRQVAQSDINMWKQLGRSPIPDAQVFIDRYERHHAAVLDYFGHSDQLLRIRLGSSNEWQELSEFLGLPKPENVPFPRANVRPYGFLGATLYRIGRAVRDALQQSDHSTRRPRENIRRS